MAGFESLVSFVGVVEAGRSLSKDESALDFGLEGDFSLCLEILLAFERFSAVGEVPMMEPSDSTKLRVGWF